MTSTKSILSHSLLGTVVGPGQCPAIDLIFGGLALDLFIRSITPPNKVTPEGRARAQVDRMSSQIAIDLSSVKGKIIHWGIRAGPMVVTLAALWFKGWQKMARPQQTRKLFWFANALTILGAGSRLWCYRLLGKYFTYELSIVDGQKVIRDGLYGYVRHPSYTGAFMTFLGTLTSGYFCNPLIPREYIPVAAAVALAKLGWMTALVAERVPDEEALLKRELGEEYEQYMKEVPYRFVPYIW